MAYYAIIENKTGEERAEFDATLAGVPARQASTGTQDLMAAMKMPSR